jgi:hypothetical protein
VLDIAITLLAISEVISVEKHRSTERLLYSYYDAEMAVKVALNQTVEDAYA